ncbi:MAG: hypothetical protein ACSLEZ_04875 [Thiobacillus sp.]
MQENKRFLPYALTSVLVLGVMSGCATQSSTAHAPASKPAATAQALAPVAAAQPVTAPTQHYFLVFHENGRIYPIADAKNYQAFLDVDELIYTRTRIGEGPEGETIVFGIQKKEAEDLNKPSLAEQFYDGKMEVAGPFYGEVIKDGRFLVFGTWQDFKDYLVNKEITYTFTEVGTGPKGETVIYAMNKKTSKEGRPVALIEAFKQFHQVK